ncbi:MAG TPA: hypothetical protein VFP44_09930 [Usitatibacter sp.]|nr:hypothetical protein [Usitatibacter sp.]
MRIARWLIGALASLSAVAWAADPMSPGSETRWRCWYHQPADEEPVIACRLLQVGTAGVDPATLAGLPPMVRRIRGDPASLLDEVVVIPLHAPPIEMRLAARLASSVMCGRTPACSVDFGG